MYPSSAANHCRAAEYTKLTFRFLMFCSLMNQVRETVLPRPHSNTFVHVYTNCNERFLQLHVYLHPSASYWLSLNCGLREEIGSSNKLLSFTDFYFQNDCSKFHSSTLHV